MVNSKYRKGYIFERDVEIFLKDKGHFITRSGASQFPDMVVVSQTGETFFLECKNHQYVPKDKTKLLSKEEYQMALNLVSIYKKPFFLFFKENHEMHAIAIGGAGASYLMTLGL